jgi:hypothetical protein
MCVTVACRAVSRQRLGKHVTEAMVTHVTIEVLLEMIFFCSVREMGVIRRTFEANLHQPVWRRGRIPPP